MKHASITLYQFVNSCETLGIPYLVYDRDKCAITFESANGTTLPYKYPKDVWLLDYGLCGCGMCAEVGYLTNYCVYIDRNELCQIGNNYQEVGIDSYMYDCFGISDEAFDLMRELAAQYSDKWTVKRKGNGLDTISYYTISVNKEVFDPEGQLIDDKCENVAICDALPDSVRKKAEEAERRYHQWLDCQCEDYWMKED